MHEKWPKKFAQSFQLKRTKRPTLKILHLSFSYLNICREITVLSIIIATINQKEPWTGKNDKKRTTLNSLITFSDLIPVMMLKFEQMQ